GYVRITIVPPSCTTPTAYSVTGGGSYCSGGSGVVVGLVNSQSSVNYQLYNGASTVGSPVAGTGSAISFGNQTAAGTYTVKAIGTGTYCAGPTDMSGSATVSVNAVPATPTITAGSSTTFCSGG